MGHAIEAGGQQSTSWSLIVSFRPKARNESDFELTKSSAGQELHHKLQHTREAQTKN
jgi:hypothetical protein